MNQSIASEAKFRQRVVKYSYKYGVTKAAVRYHRCRQAIYEWRQKYDGNSWKSLIEKSHRPHHHPNEHTPQEKAMILSRYPRYKDDMILLWDSLRKSGYTRSYTSLVRIVNKLIKPEVKKKQTKSLKPYQRADYPGQKIQIDVKFVPSYCVPNGKKYYQYTAVDECTRWAFREMYEEHSTHSSADFLMKLLNVFSLPIREVQTDNGTEFTMALKVKDPEHKTMFEQVLAKCGILYHRIRVATPRHNGKVERQHRIDEARFYKKMKMYNLADGRKQLAKYNIRSNNIPKSCLKFLSPNEVMEKYLYVM